MKFHISFANTKMGLTNYSYEQVVLSPVMYSVKHLQAQQIHAFQIKNLLFEEGLFLRACVQTQVLFVVSVSRHATTCSFESIHFQSPCPQTSPCLDILQTSVSRHTHYLHVKTHYKSPCQTQTFCVQIFSSVHTPSHYFSVYAHLVLVSSHTPCACCQSFSMSRHPQSADCPLPCLDILLGEGSKELPLPDLYGPLDNVLRVVAVQVQLGQRPHLKQTTQTTDTFITLWEWGTSFQLGGQQCVENKV